MVLEENCFMHFIFLLYSVKNWIQLKKGLRNLTLNHKQSQIKKSFEENLLLLMHHSNMWVQLYSLEYSTTGFFCHLLE